MSDEYEELDYNWSPQNSVLTDIFPDIE